MNRQYNSGKIKLSSLIIVLAVIYGGFVVFKIVTANIMKGQIRVEITDKIGIVRGPSFTVEEGINICKEVLENHGVLDRDFKDDEYGTYADHNDTENSASREYNHQVIDVRIDDKTTMVHFYLTYEYENNFIFFKQKKKYEVQGEVQNFN
jgi:hypothetical protein